MTNAPTTLTDDGIEALVAFIASAEQLAEALGMTTPQAARAILKGAQIMTERQAAGFPSALSRMGCAKTKH